MPAITVNKTLVESPEGRSSYLNYLNNNKHLSPMEVLYGSQPPQETLPAEAAKQAKQLLIHVHPD